MKHNLLRKRRDASMRRYIEIASVIAIFAATPVATIAAISGSESDVQTQEVSAADNQQNELPAGDSEQQNDANLAAPKPDSSASEKSNDLGVNASSEVKNQVVETQPQNQVPAAPILVKKNGYSARSAQLYVNKAQANDRASAITKYPIATWFGGWSNPKKDANALVSRATKAGKVASIVLYNIPARDCGSYSAGGANSSSAYREWIDQIAAGIGARKAIVIVEPDALAGLDCLSRGGQTTRLADISYAVGKLAKSTKSAIYIDAGNYSWQSTSVMTKRLKQANVNAAAGFSLNVSGFGWTKQSSAYGTTIARSLKKGFVIDTSRNGNGPAAGNAWCNPQGRALGIRPTTKTNAPYIDGYLWVKYPGESDGTCMGGPSAGTWWPDYANGLIRNSK